MKINSINYQAPYNHSFNSSGGKKTKEENGYVMIPKEKYKRDRIIEYSIIGGLLLFELIKGLCKDKPKFP